MATTKELLEKAMLRLGSRGSRPDELAQTFVVDQTSQEFQSFTAPQDGFCRASGKTTSDTSMMWMEGGHDCGYSIRALWTGAAIAFTFPVRKGDTLMCQFFQMTDRSLYFIKSVGGGLRLLRKLLGVGGCYGYA